VITHTWGDVIARLTSALPTPWRYQGRMLVSPNGASDLYDAGARFYSPALGIFTQFDSSAGSAQNPVTMNRYLYAGANPATLIDPSGHCFGICIDINPVGFVQSAAKTVTDGASAAVAAAAPVVAPVVQAANVAVEMAKDPHTLLAVASMVPVAGDIAAAVDVGLYLAEGDTQGAALASLAFVPGGAIAKLGGKALGSFEKGSKVIGALEKVGSKIASGADNAASEFNKLTSAVSNGFSKLGSKVDDALGGLRSRLSRVGPEPAFPAALTVGNNARTGVSVYKGFDKAGEWIYSGITNNIVRRAAEHTGRFKIAEIAEGLTRGQARAVEQALIDANKARKAITRPANAINSISQAHSYYDDAVQWGQWWLSKNGVKIK
jgi:RHS repeat-associated protein